MTWTSIGSIVIDQLEWRSPVSSPITGDLLRITQSWTTANPVGRATLARQYADGSIGSFRTFFPSKVQSTVIYLPTPEPMIITGDLAYLPVIKAGRYTYLFGLDWTVAIDVWTGASFPPLTPNNTW